MNKIDLHPDLIGKALSEHIKDPNSVFVFPTDIVLHSWVDYLITHTEESGVDAVAFEQFTAWDNFKKDFVSAKIEGKTVVPSVLRKMFVTDFIARNAQKEEKDRLHVIINSSDTYAKEADSFTDWLTKNIVTLHFWKKRVSEHPDYEFDDEDKDYDALYNAYNSFLDQNNLFEPSWVTDIEFSQKEKKFYIFYPELLEDFTDYKDIFSPLDNIIIFTLPEDVPSPESFFYNDSRSELRQTILEIIDLVNKGKADWSEIAISVPNLDTYRPYINREFSLYGIPYVIKAGVSLTKNSAGRIFREIYDCYNENFSFATIRNLLLDECVPWKDENTSLIENLIREGNKMRCICSVDQNDIWETALKNVANKNYALSKSSDSEQEQKEATEKSEYYYTLLNFYKDIKNAILAFFSSTNHTFNNILISWMQFKQKFLKSDEAFSEEANNILSRCITHLNEIIQIEKKYKDCNLIIPSPYSFFLSEIDKKTYTKQTSEKGVNVFPYRLSAAAFFKYQFVIDASQKNLDINYKRLTFLNNTKRGVLGLNDDDKQSVAGIVFIKLYGKNTTGNKENCVHFSASENTFNGFAIPHSILQINEKNQALNLDNTDYILNEQNFIAHHEGYENISNLTQNQLDSYKNYLSSHLEKEENEIVNEELNEVIKSKLINRFDKDIKKDNKIKITARGDLEKFFPCPRKWLLKSALKIEDDTLDTRLMQTFDMGNLNHGILEIFMNNYINQRLPYYNVNDNHFYKKVNVENEINSEPILCDEEIEDLLYGKERDCNIVLKSLNSIKDIRDCPMVKNTLMSQKKLIVDSIYEFLKTLLIEYTGRSNTGDNKKISGIGDLIARGSEKTLQSKKENFNYWGKIDFYVQVPNDKDEDDMAGNKKIIIIDYKNSKSAFPSTKDLFKDNNDKLGDFQMPLYITLIKDNNKDSDVIGGLFYGIRDCERKGTSDRRSKNETLPEGEEMTDSRRVLDDYSQLLLSHIESGIYSPHQSWDYKDKENVKSYRECRKCNFKSICRTTYQMGGKEIVMIDTNKGENN